MNVQSLFVLNQYARTLNFQSFLNVPNGFKVSGAAVTKEYPHFVLTVHMLSILQLRWQSENKDSKSCVLTLFTLCSTVKLRAWRVIGWSDRWQ